MQNLILFVDRHYRRHARLLRALMSAGFDVVLAEDDEAAMRWLEANVPDAILFDATGRSVSRLVVLQQLRAHRETQDVPVFIETDTHEHFWHDADEYPDDKTFAFDAHAPNALIGTLSRALHAG